MRRGFHCAWLVAGLAMLGAMGVDGREGRAGTIGIIGHIKQGSGTGGDPPYTYIFDLYLTSGFINSDGGKLTDFFTVDGLVGVSGSGYDSSQIANPSAPSEPPTTAPVGSPQAMEFWNTPSGGIAATPSPPPTGFKADGYNYNSNVTWEYVAGPTINFTNPGPNGVFLGEFTVNTSWSYEFGQPYPMSPGTIIDFSYTIGGTTGTGTFVLLGVPEPSSIVLMLLGGAILPLATVYRRRQLRSRRAA
jgi:hypothetical protein